MGKGYLKMNDKTLDTLVEDIYTLMKNKNSAKGVDPEEEIEVRRSH